jgi:nucleoside-diphosphate-sugar epimerase
MSAMPKSLFITGATGYIGGSVLESLVKTFPELEISALLRSPSEEFRERYPGVKVVKGSFDDFEVIEKAVEERGDVVVRKDGFSCFVLFYCCF